MGIDAGIIVKRQITDQEAWVAAMLEIEEIFGTESFFVNHLLENHPRAPPGLREVLSDELPVLQNANVPHVLDKIIACAYGDDPFLPFKLEQLHLTESLNFNHRDVLDMQAASLYDWQTFPTTCASVADVDNMASGLRERVQAKLLEDARIQGWCFDEYKLKEAVHMLHAATAMSTKQDVVARCHYLQDLTGSVCPPSLYTFRLGEHPVLPVIARHFKAFESNVYSYGGNHSGDVEDKVLKPVARILFKHFPDHLVYYFNDIPEDPLLMSMTTTTMEESARFSQRVVAAERCEASGLPRLAELQPLDLVAVLADKHRRIRDAIGRSSVGAARPRPTELTGGDRGARGGSRGGGRRGGGRGLGGGAGRAPVTISVSDSSFTEFCESHLRELGL